MLNEEQLAAAFATVMADARRGFDGTRDAFDWQIATRTFGPYSGGVDAWQEIDNALYRLANGELRQELTKPDDPTEPYGGPEGSMRRWPTTIRTRRLRELLTPQIDALVAECKSYKFVGWSSQSDGPIRRVGRKDPAEGAGTTAAD